MRNEIAEIISKVITDIDLSGEERILLNHWLNENEANKNEFKSLTDINFQVKVSELQESKTVIFNDIISQINYKKKVIRNIWIVSASAAAVILMFLIGRYSVPINSNESKLSAGLVFNVLNVPEGSKSQITLADGTKVWVNGGSKLKYPSNFSTQTREVYLDGEAFFDVAHNKSIPFLVNTSSIQIKVLGTAFNVKSYSEDKTIETTLVRGSVEIRELKGGKLSDPFLIKPNQKAIFVKESTPVNTNNSKSKATEISRDFPDLNIDHVNTSSVTSWKEHALVFDNITFEEIVTNLERWYGIKVNLANNELKKIRYKGRFSHNETIYQVLEVIKVTTPIKYEVKNYEISIDLK